MRLVILNIRGLTSAKEIEIRDMMRDLQTEVLSLSETWLDGYGNGILSNGYTIYSASGYLSTNARRRNGGVSMVVHDGIDSHELETVSNSDYRIFAISIGGTRLLCVSLRPQPGKVVIRRFLFDITRLSQGASIIMGDVKSRASHWGPNILQGMDSGNLLPKWACRHGFTLGAPGLNRPTIESKYISSIHRETV